MQATIPSRSINNPAFAARLPTEIGRKDRLRWLQLHAAWILVILLSLAADIVLPRGATAAIGYCLVPVLARATERPRLIFVLTGICTLLTWIGFIFEPAGAAWWMSVFDRAMVTGVLWLTGALVWRRVQVENALWEAVHELHRSNDELENFASVVSHDLRGPLNSIAMAMKILSAQFAIRSDPKSAEWIDLIADEVARMSALVERLLAYAHVGAGEIKLSNCDCELILSDVRRALQSQLEDAEAQITSGGLPTVCTDPALMTELLQNLVENSIKYRGAVPPRIHISGAAKPEGWLFTLSDNGIGINAEECARVFDAFYRGAAAASSDGHGLGLATCKRIVDRHGGRIEVHSRPGRGTEFHFLIPYAPAAAKLSPKRSVLKSAADRLNQR